MSCITSSVTLQPGQSFVLPAGATIIGATDSASIASVNDCADLTNIEDFTCYGVTYGESNPGQGVDPQTPVYDTVDIYGIRVNNVDYPFTSSITTYTALTGIITALNQTPYGGLFTNVLTASTPSPNRGNVRHLSFKTLPSFANDLSFYGIASGQISAPSSGSFPVEFKVLPYADFIAKGGTLAYPLCS